MIALYALFKLFNTCVNASLSIGSASGTVGIIAALLIILVSEILNNSFTACDLRMVIYKIFKLI